MTQPEITGWIVVEGYCAMRCVAGTDFENVANRVAFIEKSPRVRVAPYEGELDRVILDDHVNWEYGPKGSGGGDPETDQTYGFDPESRQWCDNRLQELGYDVSPATNETDK